MNGDEMWIEKECGMKMLWRWKMENGMKQKEVDMCEGGMHGNAYEWRFFISNKT